MQKTSYNPTLHRLAVLTACATFPLIFMGGLVTSHQAGMSVPDWPNSYGYNMFLFPPSQWVQGIFYEHTHRLMGTLVGFLSVLLTLWVWGPSGNPTVRWMVGMGSIATGALGLLSALWQFGVSDDKLSGGMSHVVVGALSVCLVLTAAYFARSREPRRSVRWLGTSVLLAVVFQGVLGGLRVVWVELDLAIVHGCFAQAFFCLTAAMVAMTSRWWIEADSAPRVPRADDPKVASSSVGAQHSALARLALLAVGLIYAQLVVGAIMRHYNAGLAIPDLPLAYGKVLPPTDAQGLAEINRWRVWQGDSHLERVTLAQVWLHFGHRVGALIVTAALAALVYRVVKTRRDQPLLVRPALLASVLLVAQLTLGVYVILKSKPADITSLHVACGAATLITTVTLALRASRLWFVARSGERCVPQADSEPQPLPFGSAATA